MKKILLYYILLVVLATCSPRKDGFTNRNSQKFNSYYNTLFNSKEALETEISSRRKSFVEDYYAGYIPLIPYDQNTLKNDGNPILEDVPLNFGGGNPENKSSEQANGSTILEIAEAKAQKAIRKHSMLFGGVEKNKYIFDAYILLAKSRMYQSKYLEAIDALKTTEKSFLKDKRLAIAKILEAQNYTLMGDFYKANEIFLALEKQSDLKKNYKALASVYFAEMLLKNNQNEEAVTELEKAYDLNKNNELRSRIAFLRGQLLVKLNRKDEAKASFVTAYKKSANFEFEIKSQIEIAKLSHGDENEYAGIKNQLEKFLKIGTYTSRRNEIYYALGKLAQNFQKEEDENKYFMLSVKERISDGQIRGLAYYEIGRKYFLKDDYIAAGNYYDSAIVEMKHKPTLESLKKTTADIKKLAKNYYLIKKNDSILHLIKMPESEKLLVFNKIIQSIKEKEAIEESIARKEKRSKGFDTGDYSTRTPVGFASTSFLDADVSKSKFYFSNQSNVAKGVSDFKKTWGERSLIDNWRNQNKAASLQDQKNLAMGKNDVPNPRRFEVNYYLEQIPRDVKKIEQLKLDRDTASLSMGIMHYQLFDNPNLATKTLFDLVENKPIDEVKQQALYQIFYNNFEKNIEKANLAKKMIIDEYPYTSYAEFVRNPIKTGTKSYNPDTEKVYLTAYQLYLDTKYSESKDLIQTTIAANKNDALVPKLSLLDAYNTAKIAGKEVLILQLEQIALNYPKTPEGVKAKKILSNLKSDLKLNLTKEIDAPKNTSNSSEDVEKLLQKQLEEEELDRQKKQKSEENEPQGPSVFPVQAPKKTS